ncbi:hypothetical protein D0T11_18360 [Hymenobacter rubripertinctus]|uniref:Uncharacterized protein n=1 Tax=Hymenobacter rubripertinctus TaxID=2029981 RepID=A0A418QN49_9BACT|nr:hypothetical protein D0T11_18360 [Hymenobacter rubripertinctus]
MRSRNHGLSVVSCWLSVVGCQLAVAGCRLPVVGWRLPVAGCRLPKERHPDEGRTLSRDVTQPKNDVGCGA